MAKIKNNPYDLLEAENISQKMLSEKALKSLGLFDKANKLYEKHPNSKDFKENAEKAGTLASKVITEDVTSVKSLLRNEAKEEEKKIIKKIQSKKMVEKSEKVLDDLAICRQKLKEDRRHKMESGEILPPKKKTLVTRLRQELLKTATLIPNKLKEDSDVIQRTQKAVLNFLNELKGIWGLNKIKPIEEQIKDKFKKMAERAEKEAA